MSPISEFDGIYRTHYPKIHKYVSKIVGPTDAEDVAQEAFEKANRNFEKFHGRSSISTWLYRIATNAAIDRIRSVSAKRASDSACIDEIETGIAESRSKEPSASCADETIIHKEMNACIHEFIERLPCDYKVILILKEFEGLSNQEIASILQITVHNAKIRLHRARVKLKEELDRGCDFYYNDRGTLACDRKSVGILPSVGIAPDGAKKR